MFRLLESLDQCASTQLGLMKYEVVDCIRKIVDKLESWCQDNNFPQEFVAKVNRLYPILEDSDFTGKEESLSVMRFILSNIQVHTLTPMKRTFQKNSDLQFRRTWRHFRKISTRVLWQQMTA